MRAALPLPFPYPFRGPCRYAVCVTVAAVVPVLVAGALGLLGAVPGAATVGGVAVMCVTVMPVTSPLTPSFCLLPIVCRAARVAVRFAAAAVLASTVSCARAFGLIPKSASASGEVP